ncbi:hypothetical protein VNO77_02153 [Canavalia gladiata]|uniref:Uncharacterized protein n=1 Tax=Canavalia gladiata TaxID=3824 RepID=A0AAN9MXQ8_CANGL
MMFQTWQTHVFGLHIVFTTIKKYGMLVISKNIHKVWILLSLAGAYLLLIHEFIVTPYKCGPTVKEIILKDSQWCMVKVMGSDNDDVEESRWCNG